MSSPDRLADHLEPPEVPVGPGRHMTEDEFVAWGGEKTRAEWVDGEVIMMSPASFEHNRIIAWLVSLLEIFVEEQDLGTICGPEFTIRLAQQRRRRVPDILFVSKERMHLVTANHLEGAPDLAVEIVSPDSADRDRREKYDEYRKAGVREYWVIDPQRKTAEFFALEQSTGAYRELTPADGKIASVVLPGLWLKTEWLWPDGRPKVLDALRAIGVPGLGE